ncbi:MAG: Amt family ammonium transporter [Verrucomicrobiales bacterium]|jgi:Amt family ammonium transporter
MVNFTSVSDDVDLLWALVAGVMIVGTTVALVAVIEGMTRRRTVSTGAARYIAAVAGAVLGSVAISSTGSFGEVSPREQWLEIAASALVGMIIVAGIAERSTFTGHLVVGVVAGAVVRPFMFFGARPGGILDSIEVGDGRFFDAGAAGVFSVAGWMALVGLMVIGPRRGRFGAEGRPRAIPGKSSSAAIGGAIGIGVGSIGLAAFPEPVWSSELFDAAIGVQVAGAVGAVVGAAVALRFDGVVQPSTVIRGLLAGVVSAAGAPLELSLWLAIVVGVVGAAAALLAVERLDRAKIDDPVGVVGVFGVAGIWGTLAVGLTEAEQFVAQLVGSIIIAAGSIVVAGVVFGVLRILRVLRVSADIEIVGLDR